MIRRKMVLLLIKISDELIVIIINYGTTNKQTSAQHNETAVINKSTTRTPDGILGLSQDLNQ